MKTKPFCHIIIVLIIVFNLAAAAVTIANGYKTMLAQKKFQSEEITQRFITSIIH